MATAGSNPTRVHFLTWLTGVILLGSLMIQNLRGNVDATGGIRHGWPAVYMTRANFRPQSGAGQERWESSSRWPVDNAEVSRFRPLGAMADALLAVVLIALSMFKVQAWMARRPLRVRVTLRLLLLFPAVCASGYWLWGNDLDAWLLAISKISFSIVVVAVVFSWLAMFDLLSLAVYRAAQRARNQ